MALLAEFMFRENFDRPIALGMAAITAGGVSRSGEDGAGVPGVWAVLMCAVVGLAGYAGPCGVEAGGGYGMFTLLAAGTVLALDIEPDVVAATPRRARSGCQPWWRKFGTSSRWGAGRE